MHTLSPFLSLLSLTSLHLTASSAEEEEEEEEKKKEEEGGRRRSGVYLTPTAARRSSSPAETHSTCPPRVPFSLSLSISLVRQGLSARE